MCGIAISRLSVTAQEFYDLTPKEFFYAISDYQEMEVQRHETIIHTVWEAARFATFHIGARIPGAKMPRNMMKLITFSWERKREKVAPKKQSIQQMKHAMHAIVAAFSSKKE